MIKWRIAAGSDAIFTSCGEKQDGAVKFGASGGCLVHGPYLDLPAGQLTARLMLARPATGRVRLDFALDHGLTVLASREVDCAPDDDHLEITCELPGHVQGAEVRLFVEDGMDLTVTELQIDVDTPQPQPPAPDRPVGEESRKTFAEKVNSGFIDTYLSGKSILEVGFRGYRDEIVLPIVPQAIGVDIGYPGYDGKVLPFADESVDAIYTSHCLEHISDYQGALRDWYRLLKVGGYLIVAVPHQYMFEKQRNLPSLSNHDHKRYYTSESLLREISGSWPENSYRIRQLVENDAGFDYSLPPEEASPGCYEIEIVVQKMKVPMWRLADGSVRTYGAAEFYGAGPRTNLWSIDLDFASEGPCKVWGPYARLVPAEYEAIFHFESELGGEVLPRDITLDVAVDRVRVAALALSGHDGAEQLRSGAIRVPFQVVEDVSHVEFRTFVDASQSNGRLSFKGVTVQFQRA